MNNTLTDNNRASRIFSSKRLAPMLLALLTFLVVVSLSWNIINQREAALDSARLHAKTVFEKDMLFRRWNAMLGGVYAPVSEETQPNPHLEGVVSERDLKTPSGRELTLVNPEFMTRQVFELEEKGKGVLGHITSLKPIHADNAADPWERESLLAFEKGTEEVSSLEMINGREYMRLMRPLEKLNEAAKDIGKGILSKKISIETRDESLLKTSSLRYQS